MMRALILATVVSAGCSGYQCDGPACPGDAAIDAGVDAGMQLRCSTSCPRGCCDGNTGRCVVLSEAQCGVDFSTDGFCVACGVGQLCIQNGIGGRCETRTSRCPTTCQGCCQEATGTCQLGTTTANCGNGGVSCQDCRPTAMMCLAGSCL